MLHSLCTGRCASAHTWQGCLPILNLQIAGLLQIWSPVAGDQVGFGDFKRSATLLQEDTEKGLLVEVVPSNEHEWLLSREALADRAVAYLAHDHVRRCHQIWHVCICFCDDEVGRQLPRCCCTERTTSAAERATSAAALQATPAAVQRCKMQGDIKSSVW
jgi:hypothetical protein